MPGTSRAPAIAVLAVALFAHFGWLIVDRAIESDDSPTYVVPAQHLAHLDGSRNTYGLFETRRTPGYPLFLAPFTLVAGGLILAVAAQHLISALLALGVYWLVDSRLRDRLAALAAGIYLGIDGASIIHANQILTETLFTAFVFGAFVLLVQRKAAAAGIVAGASVLVRPIALYLVVPVVLVLLFRREGRRAIAFAVCFTLLPVAWSARNAARGAEFTTSTITSWSILYDRAAATLAVADPGDFTANVNARRNELAREVGDTPPATYSNHVLRAIDHFHAERYTPLALRIIAAHPVDYLRAYALAIARTLFAGGATQLNKVAGLPLRAAQALVAGYTLVTTLLAAAGCVLLFRRDRELALLSLAFVAYFLVTCSMAEATSRFRVPIAPILAIWVGVAVAESVRRWRERRAAR
jgi:hypothetical protein